MATRLKSRLDYEDYCAIHYWIVDPDTRALECHDFPGLRLDLAALWR
jgi:hypothetical protein